MNARFFVHLFYLVAFTELVYRGKQFLLGDAPPSPSASHKACDMQSQHHVRHLQPRQDHQQFSVLHTVHIGGTRSEMLSVRVPMWALSEGYVPAGYSGARPSQSIIPFSEFRLESHGEQPERKPWSTPLESSATVLSIPSNITRLCVDVGTYFHSPSSKKWLAKDPSTFVIAVEANPFSASLIGRFTRPAFSEHVPEYWPSPPPPPSDPNVNATPYCTPPDVVATLPVAWRHILRHPSQIAMFSMAGTTERGAVSFQLGIPGRPDGGSMLAFRKSYQTGKQKPGRVVSPMSPLADVLRFAPAAHPDGRPILWDTLKIDAQGMDTAVLLGAGLYVRQFACVVGEFDSRAYTGSLKMDHAAYLLMHGFAKVSPMVFINRRLAKAVQMGAVMCTASDVQISTGRLHKAMKKADAKFGPWTEKMEQNVLK